MTPSLKIGRTITPDGVVDVDVDIDVDVNGNDSNADNKSGSNSDRIANINKQSGLVLDYVLCTMYYVLCTVTVTGYSGSLQ